MDGEIELSARSLLAAAGGAGVESKSPRGRPKRQRTEVELAAATQAKPERASRPTIDLNTTTTTRALTAW